MLKVGIAGIGFMGWIHWLAYQQIEDAEVVAICERDEKRRAGDWTGIQGNFGPPGTKVDLSNLSCFGDLEELCQHDFDLLDVCLPPAMHLPAIEIGAKYGKKIFCEKPLCLNLPDCESALAASANLQVGHVLPFFPEYRTAKQIIESGQYGGVRSAHFKRVISDPVWLESFSDPKKIGGPLLDLHVHDAHFIRLIAGMPLGVYSRGRLKGETVSFCHSVFDFEDPELVVASTSGVIDQQGRPFTHGFDIQLERATIHFEYAALESGDESMPLKLIADDGSVQPIELQNGEPVNAFVAEIQEMTTHVRNGTTSPILDGKLARDAIYICQQEDRSVKCRQRVPLAKGYTDT